MKSEYFIFHKNYKPLDFRKSSIEKHLKLRWSPEIISHELRNNGIKFSHMSIYTLIRKHRPEWRKLLPHKKKKLRHSVLNIEIQERTNISKRLKIIESRNRFGDFEVYTVLSCRGGKSCLAHTFAMDLFV